MLLHTLYALIFHSKGDIRKCSYEIKWKDGENEFSTFAAVIGPSEASIDTTNKDSASIDLPNHSLKLMLPANEEVLKYFKRYSKFYL